MFSLRLVLLLVGLTAFCWAEETAEVVDKEIVAAAEKGKFEPGQLEERTWGYGRSNYYYNRYPTYYSSYYNNYYQRYPYRPYYYSTNYYRPQYYTGSWNRYPAPGAHSLPAPVQTAPQQVPVSNQHFLPDESESYVFQPAEYTTPSSSRTTADDSFAGCC